MNIARVLEIVKLVVVFDERADSVIGVRDARLVLRQLVLEAHARVAARAHVLLHGVRRSEHLAAPETRVMLSDELT